MSLLREEDLALLADVQRMVADSTAIAQDLVAARPAPGAAADDPAQGDAGAATRDAADDQPPAGAGVGEPCLVVTPLTQVTATEIDWLWPGWLARGKLHLLGGHPGDGKSTLLAALAAAASRGRAWPDGHPQPTPLRSLFLLGEDAAGDTLKPRLALHDAEMAHVYTTAAIRDARGQERVFDVRQHLDLLEGALREHAIDLLVIDPLTTILPGADRNAEGEIRDRLTPLVKLAERLGVAVVGIVHVGKSSDGRRAAQKILGATAFVALARAVWMLAPDEVSPEGMVLGVVKSNLARKPP
ncbi:MAG: AAA family ATPase, partial [Thermomicrobiales bacterium]|nr:AAA family ATPase [Thermomicrobiales bacterium]